MDAVVEKVESLLNDIQSSLYERAKQYQIAHITKVDSYSEFKELLEQKGGFFAAHWDGTKATENRIKEETKATIRCIPINDEEESGLCMVTGAPSPYRVLFAKAY